MILKNSLKLFVANFSVFWKLLLYKLVAIGICALLLIPTYSAWGNALSAVNFGELFTDFATNTVFVSAPKLLADLFYVFKGFTDSISILFSANAFALFYTTFVVVLLLPFLLGLSSVPTGESLYSYMASLNRSSFMSNFVVKLKSSVVYSLIRTIIWLPIKVVLVVGSYYILQLATFGGIVSIFSPIIIVLFIVLLLAVATTLFSGIMPATVVFNISVPNSFGKGFKAVYRVFLRVLSCFLVTYFLLVMLTFIATAYSLIVLWPLTSVAVIMTQMVMFFESQGMRYYVDLDTIISPRKLEHRDKFNKVKDII